MALCSSMVVYRSTFLTKHQRKVARDSCCKVMRRLRWGKSCRTRNRSGALLPLSKVQVRTRGRYLTYLPNEAAAAFLVRVQGLSSVHNAASNGHPSKADAPQVLKWRTKSQAQKGQEATAKGKKKKNFAVNIADSN